MNKKIIIIGMAIVFLVGIAVFSSQKDKYLQKNKASGENIVKQTEKTTGETRSIVVSSGIKKVADELRQQYQN